MKKNQNNTYRVLDCSGRDTGIRYYASNKKEAMSKFKEDTPNYRKYGYFGKLSRWYEGGKWDWIDFGLTVVGAFVGGSIRYQILNVTLGLDFIHL